MGTTEIKTPTPAGEPTPPAPGEPTPPAGEPTPPEPPAPAAATLTPELVQQMIDASLGAFNDAMQILKAGAEDGDKIPPDEDETKKEETDPNKKSDDNQEDIKNE